MGAAKKIIFFIKKNIKRFLYVILNKFEKKINKYRRIKFLLLNIDSIDAKIDYLYKFIIEKSIYWDTKWYNKTYGHNFTKQEAIDYWYNIGWRNGENPSNYFNLKSFPRMVNELNPVFEYISGINHYYPNHKNNFRALYDDEKISLYLKLKSERKAKSCIYTCIVNNYDDIEQIKTHYYIKNDWDYICYTDNIEHINTRQIGIWEMRPLAFNSLDATKNNRWHKLHPHIILTEYSESIYIDANINILSDKIFHIIKDRNQSILLPEHWRDTCIYKEYDEVKRSGLESADILDAELNVLKKIGMPHNFGLTENNAIYRKHNDPLVCKIMEEWWEMIEKYSKRDQLSFMFVLYKNNICVDKIIFKNIRDMHNDFYIFAHKK